MLQILFKNRYLFMLCLIIIWVLIFLIPRIGDHYRNKKQFSKIAKNGKSPVQIQLPSKKRIEEPVTYLLAGEFQRGDKCLDTLDGTINAVPGLFKCHGEGRNQFWFLLKDTLQMKNKELCLQGPADLKTSGDVTLQPCKEIENQAWLYEKEKVQMSGSSLCLEAANNRVRATDCSDKKSQKWIVKTPPGM